MGNKATETGLTRAGRCVTVDWMAHVAFVFIVCALLALKWPVFGGRNLVLVMIGTLLTDIFKLYLPLRLIWATQGTRLCSSTSRQEHSSSAGCVLCSLNRGCKNAFSY